MQTDGRLLLKHVLRRVQKRQGCLGWGEGPEGPSGRISLFKFLILSVKRERSETLPAEAVRRAESGWQVPEFCPLVQAASSFSPSLFLPFHLVGNKFPGGSLITEYLQSGGLSSPGVTQTERTTGHCCPHPRQCREEKPAAGRFPAPLTSPDLSPAFRPILTPRYRPFSHICCFLHNPRNQT